MKDLASLNAKYFPDRGGIAWPEEPAVRVELARAILGLGFVEAHDFWISRARDILNPSGPALAESFNRELGIRAALRGIGESERGAIEELIRVAVHGALFSALASLDQFPRADLSISVSDSDAGIGPLVVAPGDEGLHDSFFEWLDRYSSESRPGE